MNSIMCTYLHMANRPNDYKVRRPPPPPRRPLNNETGLSYAFEAPPPGDCTEPGKYTCKSLIKVELRGGEDERKLS